MANAREIRGRIKAVGNIQRITKTMQMIATARFQASQRRATASQPYSKKIAELVGELSAAAGEGENSFSHPLLKAPAEKVNRELVLVLTSNRGLCGGYNANILRTASIYRNEYLAKDDTDMTLEVVGKKGTTYFKFAEVEIDKSYLEFGDQPKFEDVEQLAIRFMEEFEEGKYDAIKVIYMAFETMARQSPKVLQLLPMANPTDEVETEEGGSETNAPAPGQVDYDFSPDPIDLLNELLPQTVKTQLFQCFNESVVSEQIARMMAMKAATDNAGKMGKELKRIFNRARQTAITTELMEIIAGSAALE